MRKTLITLCAFSSAAILLTGCTNGSTQFADSGTFIPSPKDVQKMLFNKKVSNEDLVSKSDDQEMAKAFAGQKINKVTSMDFEHGGIFIEKKRLYETDSFIYFSKARGFYRNLAFDFLQDEVAKKYLDVVNKRGNGYIVYNGNANQKLLQAMVGGNLKQNTNYEVFMYDSDFAIVEYDKNGNKVSALLRQARIEPSQLGMSMGDKDPAVTIHQSVFLVLQSNVNKIDLNMSSDELEKYEYKRYNMPEKHQGTIVQTIQQPVQIEKSKADKIKELYELLKAGALTQDEFDKEKAKILSSSNQTAQPAPVQVQQSSANPMELMIVQKFNEKYKTNFTTMKEVQEYMKKYQN